VKLVERFEPQSKIKNGGKTGKRKAATTSCRLSFAKDQCWQGERQEDEHEGDAYADHLHPVAHWICLLEEKDGEEDDEGCLDQSREQQRSREASAA
jgi:hypothetical protein